MAERTCFSQVGTVTAFGTVAKDRRNPLLKIGSQLAADKDPGRPWSSGGIYSAIVADQSEHPGRRPFFDVCEHSTTAALLWPSAA
jgi:hypothetical protein